MTKTRSRARELYFVGEALRRVRDFDDPVPPDLLGRLGLVDRTRAYNGIHQPELDTH